VIPAVAGFVVLTREEPVPPVEITAAQVEAAQQAAACTPVDVPQLGADHLDPATAPPPEQLYPVRPASSGPHFGAPLAAPGFSDEPVDERSAVHNLEHRAVIVWYDPDQVADPSAIRRWVEQRNRAGFSAGGGGAVIASPFPQGLDSGKAVALRAWNRAVDCGGFDPAAADGFLTTSFGTRGEAPEGFVAGYPEGAVTVVEQSSPAPTTQPAGSP
jgi:hypothetical protein